MSAIITILVAFLGLFILYILVNKNKKAHDYSLIILNLVCAILIYTSFRLENNLTPISFYIHNTLPFWIISIFMLYAYQLLSTKAWQKFYLFFFVLTIPMTLYVTYDVFLADHDFYKIIKSRFIDPPMIYHFFYKGNMIYAIVLSIILLKNLKTYRKKLQLQFSYIEKIRFKWLGHYTIALIIIYSFSLIGFLSYNFNLIENIDVIYISQNLLVMLAFFYLSFHGVRHYNLENAPLIDDIQPDKSIDNTRKLNKKEPHNKSDENSTCIFNDLISLFEKEELYKNTQLKLADVARYMNIPPHQLSQIINSKYGKPFYDFVASYRVNLLKEQLINPLNKKYTILSIGLACGFYSKASLNRVFKEHTGQTPSQYQKSHLAK